MPRGGEHTDGVALGRLDVNDSCAEAEQLPARERPGEVPREIDDEKSLERLHGARP